MGHTPIDVVAITPDIVIGKGTFTASLMTFRYIAFKQWLLSQGNLLEF